MSVSGFRISGAVQKYDYTALDNISVTNSHLANSSVSSEKIIDEAVTTRKLYPLSVTAEKMANATINNAKFANNALPFYMVSSTAMSADGSSVGADVLFIGTEGVFNITNDELRERLVIPRLLMIYTTSSGVQIALYESYRTYATEGSSQVISGIHLSALTKDSSNVLRTADVDLTEENPAVYITESTVNT